ncbi:FKBP-type peptidyl-prolyl cis-trans isomerase [Qipengyuania sp. 1NDW9]|uniref:Peptidyl-prolyl cis-trans isomerase n=1 Tax=Qipengyuania aquimaris TaxID=255984 RepID=A0A9Q3S154_9SPHN|nr:MULTISPECIES: FKBP-type peptidyl-prolyl cis-trans isomerase [Qipengyuania]MBX7492608.1 FKBP-type peptidyl-prolyl cis-trans isomerase [Qipengyuania xiapuensis]MBY6218218.1 FKBP-type peptidyl-prolyl cis-trans isomerase [Qipengyuania aquimaris]UOR15306.1 FKBP-type peptidyl-prolyl cis-trans isomerase [Qipengyuania aquimaris]
MTTPKNGDTVTIDYVLKRGDGEEVGTTAQTGPQDLQLGSGQIFPQIEEALTGLEVGQSATVAIESDNAFGPRREELVIDIPRANLPPEPAPQPGMALQAQSPDGQPMTLIILEVGDEAVKVDGNHPLAGEDVTFELTLRDIKQAA